MHEIDQILENMVVTQYMRDQNLGWITYKNRGEGINSDVLIHAACAYPKPQKVWMISSVRVKVNWNQEFNANPENWVLNKNPCMKGANSEQKAENVLENTRWPHSQILDRKLDWSILRKIPRGLASNHVVMDGNREFNDNF